MFDVAPVNGQEIADFIFQFLKFFASGWDAQGTLVAAQRTREDR
jgi:hypothetical protein